MTSVEKTLATVRYMIDHCRFDRNGTSHCEIKQRGTRIKQL